MSEWREWRLGALVDAAGGHIKTGPFGSQLHAHEYTTEPGGIPVVMPKDMVRGRVERRSVSRVDSATAERLEAHYLARGDVVLARRGDVGRFAFVEDDEAGWLCGTGSMRVHAPDHTVVLPRFLRYALDEPRVAEWLIGQSVGSTMPNLNAKIVAGLPLLLPDPPTQRRIASVLSAFDELIEINERRIELLEDLARSLYREWFVRLRFPGHEHVERVDSELGLVPEGWDVRPLGDLVDALVDGDWIETKDQGGDAYRLLQVSNVGVGAFRETGKFRYVSSDTFSRLRCTEIRLGDLLVSRMPEPIGRAWLVDYLSEPAITAVDVAIARPASREQGIYLNYWFNSPTTLSNAEGLATGTTRKRISRSVLSRLDILVPERDLLLRFHDQLAPVLRMQTALRRTLSVLASTRDLLLPRLVTGRLDISEIELGDLLPYETA